MRTRARWMGAVMLGVLASACANPSLSTPLPYTNLNPSELAAWMESEDVVLVNTHIPYEGEIPGTDAFLPYDEIEGLVGQLPSDRNAPLILYCRSGRMSAIAGNTLSDLGFTNLYNLEGGMIAWEQAGLPLEGR